ncbi:MAG: MYG1 family protein [Chlamydiota bacterium]|nr:MYG1 family protein [Chlamydiota bacterium]
MAVKKNLRTCGTHDGTFHADEVTACALLIMFDLIDEDKVIRTRDPDILKNCEYVCDVGGGYDPDLKLFDHHQVEYQGSLSSAGMILLYLKNQGIINSEEYHLFNNNLISGVDDHDNGHDPQIPGLCTYSHIMSNYVPIHYDSPPVEQEAAFFEALSFALGHLRRMYERYLYTQSCQEIVAAAMESHGEYLLFDKAIPWMDPFFSLGGIHHPAQFVIMPTGTHWKLRGIPPSPDDKMEVRLPLPVEWAGHLDQDLKAITGIDGAIFCHKGRFISVWENRDDAIAAMEFILKNAKKELQ